MAFVKQKSASGGSESTLDGGESTLDGGASKLDFWLITQEKAAETTWVKEKQAE